MPEDEGPLHPLCSRSFVNLHLLPNGSEEAKVLEVMVAGCAIDGLSHEARPGVGDFPLEASSGLVNSIRRELQ